MIYLLYSTINNTTMKSKIMLIMLVLSIGMSSCTKDDPQPHDPNAIYYPPAVEVSPLLYSWFKGKWSGLPGKPGGVMVFGDTSMRWTFNEAQRDTNGNLIFVSVTQDFYYELLKEQNINIMFLDCITDPTKPDSRTSFGLLNDNAWLLGTDTMIRQ